LFSGLGEGGEAFDLFLIWCNCLAYALSHFSFIAFFKFIVDNSDCAFSSTLCGWNVPDNPCLQLAPPISYLRGENSCDIFDYDDCSFSGHGTVTSYSPRIISTPSGVVGWCIWMEPRRLDRGVDTKVWGLGRLSRLVYSKSLR